MPIIPPAIQPKTEREYQRFYQESLVRADVEIFTVAQVATLDPLRRCRVILVSNEAGGYTMAFSDGTNWRRAQDRAIVS